MEAASELPLCRKTGIVIEQVNRVTTRRFAQDDGQTGDGQLTSGWPTNHPESLDPRGTCCVGYNHAHAWHSGPVQN